MPLDSDAFPQLVVIADPNGAGKSTSASALLQNLFLVKNFVNADVIAQGLAGFSPESAALEAGKIMLERLRTLAERRSSFAFETTLASRSYAPWMRSLQADGYRLRLIYLWLSTPEIALQRVQLRVAAGGHSIDPATVVRRYTRGLRNFFEFYRPIVDDWRMYNNSTAGAPRLIATGKQKQTTDIVDDEIWARLTMEYDHG